MRKLCYALTAVTFAASLAAGALAQKPDNKTDEFVTIPEYHELYSNSSAEENEMLTLDGYNRIYGGVTAMKSNYYITNKYMLKNG